MSSESQDASVVSRIDSLTRYAPGQTESSDGEDGVIENNNTNNSFLLRKNYDTSPALTAENLRLLNQASIGPALSALLDGYHRRASIRSEMDQDGPVHNGPVYEKPVQTAPLHDMSVIDRPIYDRLEPSNTNKPSLQLNDSDVEVLKIITLLADQNHPESNSQLPEFSALFSAFDSFMKENHISSQSSGKYLNCFDALLSLAQAPGPTWNSRLEAFLVEYRRIQRDLIIQERLKVSMDQFRLKTLKRLLHAWYTSYIGRHSKDTILLEQARNQDRIQLLREAFRTWKRVSLKHQSIENVAIAGYERRLKANMLYIIGSRYRKIQMIMNSVPRLIQSRYMIKWIDKSKRIQGQNVAALTIDSNKLKSSFFSTWCETYKEVIADNNFNRHLASDKFVHWFNRTLDVQDQMKTAISYDSLQVTRPSFMAWKAQTAHLVGMMDDAVYLSNGWILKRLFATWVSKHRLSIMTRKFVSLTVVSKTTVYFDRWKLLT